MLRKLLIRLGIAYLFGKLKSVPRWVWYGLAGILLIVLGVITIMVLLDKFESKTRLSERNAVTQEYENILHLAHEDALDWKNDYEKASNQLVLARRETHEANVRANAVLAQRLLSEGPGKARVGPIHITEFPHGTCGHVEASTEACTPPVGVPSEDRIVVSWKWLVTVLLEHDDLLAEADAWRKDHQEQEQLYNEKKAQPEVNNKTE